MPVGRGARPCLLPVDGLAPAAAAVETNIPGAKKSAKKGGGKDKKGAAAADDKAEEKQEEGAVRCVGPRPLRSPASLRPRLLCKPRTERETLIVRARAQHR